MFFGRNAGIIGLVIITLERYFKVVHAIGHRKYYHKWMTKVGVALPWINAFSTFAVGYVWVKPVARQCSITIVIPSRKVCVY